MSSRLRLLIDLASLLSREVDLDTLLRTACEQLAGALSADRATIWLVDAERGDLFTSVADLPEISGLRLPLGQGIAGFVAQSGETVRLADAASDGRFDRAADQRTGYTTRSMLAVPIRERASGAIRGVLQVLNHERGAFDADDEEYLIALAAQLAQALSLTTLRARDADAPGVTLRGPFNRIVGTSAAMRGVYERIMRTAESDATVLLRGPTGSGKGLFARAIHVNSARQGGPFVTLDCTTLPAQLAESELFGHERGAFTGADRRVQGRIELAQGGTLFIDELGDLPIELQGKFLRFLQERTFERVGGRTTMSADVRIVSATHRDLAKLVREGKFREDLYFRIRVVELTLPSLAARGEGEIMTLADHFVRIYGERYQRLPLELSPEARAVLCGHSWPGNVRELEHWIESAVVLSRGSQILPQHFPVEEPREDARAEDAVSLPLGLPLEEVERRYIEATIAREGNKTEAAKKLGIGRNTLTRVLGRRSP